MCISESKKQNKKQILQSVLNLEMFQNYLGNFKKNTLLPGCIPEILRQVGLKQSPGISTFNKLPKVFF